MRIVIASALLLALAACGQPAPESTTASSGASTATASETAAATATVDPAVQTALAALPAPYNEANYEAGRTIFNQCRSCHTINQGGANMVGPNLHGVIGRHVASVASFTYSAPLRGADFNWDAEHLDQWITNPQAMFPGTRMAFAGVHDATQRRDVIAYMMVESAR